ncbi:hypothetical protein TNIN_51 [Trichonephila inaurata madagascariensis]|uniref:Uncharacterized protein n=1 Tax=Trichonephila inaurata madagascariensis TaxID=2747483 RepID=A0A8X7C0R6_9ARAC|nr:hypothetical protein TNIN_51 [Trichonephila inaurata madagascariensis]
MCRSIDAKTPNSKLWQLTKFFSNDQPQVKDNNIVLDSVGQIPQDSKEAANILGKFYNCISILSFDENDKKVKKIAKKMYLTRAAPQLKTYPAAVLLYPHMMESSRMTTRGRLT